MQTWVLYGDFMLPIYYNISNNILYGYAYIYIYMHIRLIECETNPSMHTRHCSGVLYAYPGMHTSGYPVQYQVD